MADGEKSSDHFSISQSIAPMGACPIFEHDVFEVNSSVMLMLSKKTSTLGGGCPPCTIHFTLRGSFSTRVRLLRFLEARLVSFPSVKLIFWTGSVSGRHRDANDFRGELIQVCDWVKLTSHSNVIINDAQNLCLCTHHPTVVVSLVHSRQIYQGGKKGMRWASEGDISPIPISWQRRLK